jgi:hypothetical protein
VIGRVLLGGLVVLGVIIVVAVLLTATGGNGKPAPTASTPTTNALSGHHHHAKAKPFDTGKVTVAVLNGTSISGLAARISGQLAGFGYRQGPTTNAADQTHTTTVVHYLPGHRADAVAVAHSLKLRMSAVAPVDSGTRAIACAQSTTCAVDVVVTIGTDFANR